jgi:helicase SWR1
VEEALLRKANQKRSLDDLVIQKGEFDWSSIFKNESALNNALGAVEDAEDARAAALATKEALEIEGADEVDFGAEIRTVLFGATDQGTTGMNDAPEAEEEEGGTCVEYMLDFIRRDMEHFKEWRL